jgi:hypothetical protein
VDFNDTSQSRSIAVGVCPEHSADAKAARRAPIVAAWRTQCAHRRAAYGFRGGLARFEHRLRDRRLRRSRAVLWRSAGNSDCIITPSSVASSALLPKVRWLRSTIACAPVGSRRSRLRRHGWCRWRAGRRRNLAIPTYCGRRGFWLATPASMDRRRDMRASSTWCRLGVYAESEPTTSGKQYLAPMRLPDSMRAAQKR